MKQKAWYQQWPVMVTVGVASLGALGTFLVRSASYVQLPDAMAAVQKKNELQDDAILEMKKSNEIWQDIYQSQQLNQRTAPTLREELEVAESPAIPVVTPDPDDPDLWQWTQDGVRWCSDGRIPWKWKKKTKCQR
jgi:hypothetical protein